MLLSKSNKNVGNPLKTGNTGSLVSVSCPSWVRWQHDDCIRDWYVSFSSAGQHRGIGFSSGQQIWQNHAGHFFDSNETGGGIYKYKIQELLKEKKNTKYKYKIMLASSFLAIGQALRLVSRGTADGRRTNSMEQERYHLWNNLQDERHHLQKTLMVVDW